MKIIIKQYILISILVASAVISACVPGTEPWPDGKIPYRISGEFDQYDRSIIENAMDEWESVANIDFISPEGYDSSEVLKIKAGNEYKSFIGFSSGESFMMLRPGYLEPYIALHELGHVLGLEHEHQREDRDDNILILWENVEEGQDINFKKKISIIYNMCKYEYDYLSIMHYSDFDFSRNGEPIFELPKGMINTIIGGSEISHLDILKVRDIYGI